MSGKTHLSQQIRMGTGERWMERIEVKWMLREVEMGLERREEMVVV